MATKPRKKRDTTLSHVDKSAPAYRVVYGVFGGLTPFCRATGYKTSRVQWWVRGGIIPSDQFGHILAVATRERLKLKPELLVPAPALNADLAA